jgi:hypothetical protein
LSGGGGGGAASVGLPPIDSSRNNTTVTGNDGGTGIANDITGTSLFYAGGGGGGYDGLTTSGGTGGSGVGGDGGKGDSNATPATANSGGGGGGDSAHAGRTAGAAGVVVVRVLTSTVVAGGNLTLQSQATTAASAPTTGDLVVLIDDGGSGTSAVQTNIKGFISRNGNFATLDTDHKQVTFVDEGTWGTTKQKILVARNVVNLYFIDVPVVIPDKSTFLATSIFCLVVPQVPSSTNVTCLWSVSSVAKFPFLEMKPFILVCTADVPEPPSSISTTKSPVVGADAAVVAWD